MIHIATDDAVDDGANIGVLVGNDVAYLVFRLLS